MQGDEEREIEESNRQLLNLVAFFLTKIQYRRKKEREVAGEGDDDEEIKTIVRLFFSS